ncbi:MarR family winged helix-turn-helix transcriptional regulator [Blastococcus deserti]|uniref:MarR family winged helix-turn-helix transcriptional regulator n=1 Tax=Blastococcus deserti TaxID=2259033 RepID=A0ABW4XDE9_9ACTN
MRTPEDDVLLGLARVVVGISTRAADQLGALSVVQLRALTVLRSLGVVNLGQLAEGMGVTVSTASRLVDRLVAAGLVDRRPSPRSRRELALAVSGQGAAVLDRYDDLRLVGLRALLDRCAPDRRPGVLAALGELTGTDAPSTDPAGVR